MKSISNYTFPVFLFLFIAFSCKENQQTENAETTEEVSYLEESKGDFDERMKWWRDATYGMFIHWGPYSEIAGNYQGQPIEQNAAEWIMKYKKIPIPEYEQFAKQFVPEHFDAEEWVSLAKQAGMKYIVITSKHHDGFSIWNSEVSDYDFEDFTTYDKDPLAELAAECKRQNMPLGFYHSIMDWHHPKAQADTYTSEADTTAAGKEDFADFYENYLKIQLKELVENYDPEIMWFDGEWTPEYTHEQGLDLYQYVRSLKPSIIINNRVDKGRQGMQGMNKEGEDYAGDFGTPEQEILENASDFDWESCMTMNKSWGYKEADNDWKSSVLLIHNLIDVAAKGGNYLLNVGPTGEGKIPQESIKRLQDVGKWLEVNGEAIYATEKLSGNYKQGDSIRFTKSGDMIYAFSYEDPSGEFALEGIAPAENSKVQILGFNENLEWTFENGSLKIQVPADLIDQIGNSAAYTFKITGQEM